MTKPFDKEFAEQLKRSDQYVAIDADALTRELVRLRNLDSKRRQQAVSIGVIAGLASMMVAVAWWNSGGTNSFGEHANQQQPVVPVEKIPVKQVNDTMNSDSFEDFFTNQLMLADAKTKLRDLERKVRSLQQTKARQEWILAREVVSRVSIGPQSIAPYEL